MSRRSQLRDELPTAHARKPKIQHDSRWATASMNRAPRLLGAREGAHLIPFAGEELDERLSDVLIVIDNKNLRLRFHHSHLRARV